MAGSKRAVGAGRRCILLSRYLLPKPCEKRHGLRHVFREDCRAIEFGHYGWCDGSNTHQNRGEIPDNNQLVHSRTFWERTLRKACGQLRAPCAQGKRLAILSPPGFSSHSGGSPGDAGTRLQLNLAFVASNNDGRRCAAGQRPVTLAGQRSFPILLQMPNCLRRV